MQRHCTIGCRRVSFPFLCVTAAALLSLCTLLSGCTSPGRSRPLRVVEDDNANNYIRAFAEPVPPGVTVVHSVVAVAFSSGPAVVTSDEFDFELLAPAQWVQSIAKQLHMHHSDTEFTRAQFSARKQGARLWYAPKPLHEYDLYRDVTSIAHAQMLVDKNEEPDGRRRVFISQR